jgi:hypothetical protein
VFHVGWWGRGRGRVGDEGLGADELGEEGARGRGHGVMARGRVSQGWSPSVVGEGGLVKFWKMGRQSLLELVILNMGNMGNGLYGHLARCVTASIEVRLSEVFARTMLDEVGVDFERELKIHKVPRTIPDPRREPSPHRTPSSAPSPPPACPDLAILLPILLSPLLLATSFSL